MRQRGGERQRERERETVSERGRQRERERETVREGEIGREIEKRARLLTSTESDITAAWSVLYGALQQHSSA